MSKQWKPGRKTIELRPSRIRRDPVRADKPAGAAKKVHWRSHEREMWVGVIGIVLFALALNALWFGINEVMSH